MKEYSDMSESRQYEKQEQVSQWADLMGQLFDKLTGKEAVISYGFRNLEVDIYQRRLVNKDRA
jgi:hypothetical protein